MGMAVVTVAAGGLPVVDATSGARGLPVEEAANGRGVAVTKVSNGRGMPVVYAGAAGPPLGPELVTDGGFADDGGWTLVGAAVLSGGTLQLGGSNARANRTAASTITAGNYRATLTIVSGTTTGILQVGIGGSNQTIAPAGSGPGTYTLDGASAALSQLVEVRGGVNTGLVVDNFSVKSRP